MGDPRLSLLLGFVFVSSSSACTPGASDAHDVAVLGGEEVGLDAPEDAQRVMTAKGAELLACNPGEVTVTPHTYGNLSYWVASGCSGSETLAVARRCAPFVRQGCA